MPPSFKDNLKGIPTADEEALQAPAIDPILAASFAAPGSFGPMMASKFLFQQILANAIMPRMGKMNSMPLPMHTSQINDSATGGPIHLQELGDYLAHKNKMTPGGVTYDTLDDFNRWVADKWLRTTPNSMGDKVFSKIIRTVPYVKDYVKKYGPQTEEAMVGDL